MIDPQWPRPARVRAVVTTRREFGIERKPYGFNLAGHVGDESDAVASNRRRLKAELGLDREPGWLRQVHGTRVVQLPSAEREPEADGAWTADSGLACAVLTADCLPVLFCDEDASAVAAAHAGWRGLAAGIVEATVTAMRVAPRRLSAWLGPTIGPEAFEVGSEVRAAFIARNPDCAACFRSLAQGKFLADLCGLARILLRDAGIEKIYGGDVCSHTDTQRFYSYRREDVCGRFASLVWLADE